MTTSDQQPAPIQSVVRDVGAPLGILAGTACGVAAAVLYTASNIALRKCTHLDPFLVSAVKAYPTVIVLGPFLIWMSLNRKNILTNPSAVWRFAVVALIGQFIGNGAFQVALGIIGLAKSVPITLGVLLIGGGLLGRFILGEPLKVKTLLAITTLLAAVVVLSTAKDTGPATLNGPLWFGAACAAASGAAYALFGTVMRQTMNNGVSAPLAMFTSGLIGSIALSAYTMTRMTIDDLAGISEQEWGMMSTGGAFNLIAFVALSLALKSLPVVAVNLINASQVAMAAVAGVLLFAEPVTSSLIIGLALTILGLVILGYRARAIGPSDAD
jgi:drug/metabolite transporter, DME family